MPSPSDSIDVIQNDIEYIKKGVDEVKAQVKLTNGRVSALERWRAYIIGFCACVTILLLPLVFEVLSRVLDAVRF